MKRIKSKRAIPCLRWLDNEKTALILESLDRIDEYITRLEYYKNIKTNVVTFLDDDYPIVLREISDPPPILYYRGEYSIIDINYIAIVGTTMPSQAGVRLSVDLAKAIVDPYPYSGNSLSK